MTIFARKIKLFYNLKLLLLIKQIIREHLNNKKVKFYAKFRLNALVV